MADAIFEAQPREWIGVLVHLDDGTTYSMKLAKPKGQIKLSAEEIDDDVTRFTKGGWRVVHGGTTIATFDFTGETIETRRYSPRPTWDTIQQIYAAAEAETKLKHPGTRDTNTAEIGHGEDLVILMTEQVVDGVKLAAMWAGTAQQTRALAAALLQQSDYAEQAAAETNVGDRP